MGIKNKLTKIFKIVLPVFLAIIILSWLLLKAMFYPACVQNKNIFISPDSKFQAIIFGRHCGFVGVDSVQVVVKGVRFPTNLWGTTVFYARDIASAQIEWSDSATLVISCDADPLRVEVEEKTYKAIVIKTVLSKSSM